MGGSYHMELAGLKKVKAALESEHVKVKVLITDRHPQIQKWIRDNWKTVTHYFDIWHVAKGIYQQCTRPFCYYLAMIHKWIKHLHKRRLEQVDSNIF